MRLVAPPPLLIPANCMQNFDPGSPEFTEALLAEVRGAFPLFYTRATTKEAQTMDALALAHAALTVLLNLPRSRVSTPVQHPLEKASDQIDQLFASLREAVRSSLAFQTTTVTERSAIERMLFTVAPPLGS